MNPISANQIDLQNLPPMMYKLIAVKLSGLTMEGFSKCSSLKPLSQKGKKYRLEIETCLSRLRFKRLFRLLFRSLAFTKDGTDQLILSLSARPTTKKPKF